MERTDQALTPCTLHVIHVLVAFALLVSLVEVQAQTPRYPDPPAPPITTPIPPDQQDHRMPHVQSEDPIPQSGRANGRWSWSDGPDTSGLHLTHEQLRQLRALGAAYDEHFRELSDDPTTHSDYPALNDQWMQSVRSVLSQAQYDQWVRSTYQAPPKGAGPTLHQALPPPQ